MSKKGLPIQNFKMDFKDWKNSFSFQGVKDTIRYNFKNNSFKGATAKGMSWSKRKGYIKTSAKKLQLGIKNSQEIESIIFGEKEFGKSVKSKIKKFPDIGKVLDKTSEFNKDFKNTYENSYESKQRDYIVEGN